MNKVATMWWLLLLFASRLCSGQEEHAGTPDSEHGLFYHFVTRPDIEAPKWEIEVYDEAALQPDSYWFISPYKRLRQREWMMWNGPHIYRTNGELVWAGASFNSYYNGHDFRVAYLPGGERVLSVIWPGEEGYRAGWILDETYSVKKIVDMKGSTGFPNMHEFNIVDGGKHALTVIDGPRDKIQVALPDYNGTCDPTWQGFKEIDVATGEETFVWLPNDHVDIQESTYHPFTDDPTWDATCHTHWDFMHINSVDKFTNGDYLISSRHTNTIFKISHVDHSIVWRLGGSKSDFDFKDDSAKFSRQHYARVRGENATHTLISIFDNAVSDRDDEDASSNESWALLLALRTDVTPMTVEVVHRYGKPEWNGTLDPNLFSASRGSVDYLPNGNIFIGWVVNSHLSEHAPDGRVLMQAILSKTDADTYRTYKAPWVGRPAQPPDVVVNVDVSDSHLTSNIYVSWNGATEVEAWRVLHTDESGASSEEVASSPRTGFETSFKIDGFLQNVVAVALDKDGREIGRSLVATASTPRRIKPSLLEALTKEWLKSHNGTSAANAPSQLQAGSQLWVIVGVAVLTVLAHLAIANRKTLTSLWTRKPSYQSVAGDEEYEFMGKRYVDETTSKSSQEVPDDASVR